MKKIVIVVLMFISLDIQAQNEIKDSSNFIFISSGLSLASTGDLSGFHVLIGFQKRKKKWSYILELATTIHDGFNSLFYQLPSGNLNDGSIRFTTAGIQIAGISFLNLFKNNKSTVDFGFGGLLRYQTSSRYDMYEIQYPGLTGLSYPVIVFYNTEKMRTFAIGSIAKLSYHFNLSKKLIFGINSSFQIDTNGDNFLNTGLKFGCRL
jgi:hypothetical protein